MKKMNDYLIKKCAGSRIRDRDPENFTLDPGVKKHRIPDPDPQHWCTLVVGEHVIVNLLIN
jgi:hypothetical protein